MMVNKSITSLLNDFNFTIDEARVDDEFIRYAIGNITRSNKSVNGIVNFLKRVDPERSFPYLFCLTKGSSKRKHLLSILKGQEMSDYLGKKLVGKLNSPEAQGIVEEAILYQGPSKYVINPLVGALQDEVIIPSVSRILLGFHPRFTIPKLGKAVTNPERSQAASRIIKGYAAAALFYLDEIEPKSLELEGIIQDIKDCEPLYHPDPYRGPILKVKQEGKAA